MHRIRCVYSAVGATMAVHGHDVLDTDNQAGKAKLALKTNLPAFISECLLQQYCATQGSPRGIYRQLPWALHLKGCVLLWPEQSNVNQQGPLLNHKGAGVENALC